MASGWSIALLSVSFENYEILDDEDRTSRAMTNSGKVVFEPEELENDGQSGAAGISSDRQKFYWTWPLQKTHRATPRVVCHSRGEN